MANDSAIRPRIFLGQRGGVMRGAAIRRDEYTIGLGRCGTIRTRATLGATPSVRAQIRAALTEDMLARMSAQDLQATLTEAEWTGYDLLANVIGLQKGADYRLGYEKPSDAVTIGTTAEGKRKIIRWLDALIISRDALTAAGQMLLEAASGGYPEYKAAGQKAQSDAAVLAKHIEPLMEALAPFVSGGGQGRLGFDPVTIVVGLALIGTALMGWLARGWFPGNVKTEKVDADISDASGAGKGLCQALINNKGMTPEYAEWCAKLHAALEQAHNDLAEATPTSWWPDWMPSLKALAWIGGGIAILYFGSKWQIKGYRRRAFERSHGEALLEDVAREERAWEAATRKRTRRAAREKILAKQYEEEEADRARYEREKVVYDPGAIKKRFDPDVAIHGPRSESGERRLGRVRKWMREAKATLFGV